MQELTTESSLIRDLNKHSENFLLCLRQQRMLWQPCPTLCTLGVRCKCRLPMHVCCTQFPSTLTDLFFQLPGCGCLPAS